MEAKPCFFLNLPRFDSFIRQNIQYFEKTVALLEQLCYHNNKLFVNYLKDLSICFFSETVFNFLCTTMK